MYLLDNMYDDFTLLDSDSMEIETVNKDILIERLRNGLRLRNLDSSVFLEHTDTNLVRTFKNDKYSTSDLFDKEYYSPFVIRDIGSGLVLAKIEYPGIYCKDYISGKGVYNSERDFYIKCAMYTTDAYCNIYIYFKGLVYSIEIYSISTMMVGIKVCDVVTECPVWGFDRFNIGYDITSNTIKFHLNIIDIIIKPDNMVYISVYKKDDKEVYNTDTDDDACWLHDLGKEMTLSVFKRKIMLS